MPPIATTLSLNTNFLTRKSLSDFAFNMELLLCPALLEDSSDDVVYEQPHTGKVCKCVVFAGLPYSYFKTNRALPASTLCVLGWPGLSLIRCYTRLQPATLLCVILLRYKQGSCVRPDWRRNSYLGPAPPRQTPSRLKP